MLCYFCSFSLSLNYFKIKSFFFLKNVPAYHIPCNRGGAGTHIIKHIFFGGPREMAQKEGSNCTVSPPTGRKRGPELGRFRVKVTFHGDRGRA